MTWLFALAAVAALLVWAGARARKEAQRKRLRDAADYAALARSMIDGDDPRLWQQRFHDVVLRHLQIVGQSLHIVYETKNDKTRESRISVAQDMLDELHANGWNGLPPELRQHAHDAVQRGWQYARYAAAISSASKHAGAADRAKRPATRRKYVTLALHVLLEADGANMPAPLRESLAKTITFLKGSLAELNAAEQLGDIPGPLH